ncbi:MAG: tetratricopeptide repeat protein [Sedimentisphaerales bacterium]|nr:tetratricopeptide repeat protein [Sedimentisphaerales bacterium]
MSRFTQLEFGEEPGKKPSKDQGEAIRNERYFYQEAVKYWLNGDFEPALRNFSRTLEKNSSFYEGWLGQILMLIELEEYPEALIWADKALALYPEHPEILATKAIACVRDAKIDKALAYSDNAMSKENISSRVWLARAEVMMERRSRMAQDCISNAISIAGKALPVVRLEAGKLLRRRKNYSSALELLSQAAKELPQSALAWYELGCCQAGMRFREAEVAFEQALKIRPDWDLAQASLKKYQKRGLFRRLFGRG